MADCGPSCTALSCVLSPLVGFGSAGSGALATGNLALGGIGFGYGPATPAGTSSSLGTLSGVLPSCVNQLPPVEILIQPPSSVLTIPGHILSASCEPTTVGGNTTCAIRGSGIAYGRNLWSPNLFGGYLGGRQGICLPPC